VARLDPEYFRRLQAAGSTIEDHTIRHSRLPTISPAAQRAEVCDAADRLTDLFGVRPTLFRAPFGVNTTAALTAVRSCGMVASVLWMASTNDGRLDVQQRRLRPGDIILMHFRTDLYDNLMVVEAKLAEAGLTPARLEDYLRP
jgi:peptidoglycan/xylan/chitin deacetylase (PgdA/CDA1 family)